MNRSQLDALLKAGLITAAQHTQALATLTLTGALEQPPALELHLMAPAVRLDVQTDDEGNPTGGILTADVLTRYDELVESHGTVIHSGALVARAPLMKNKILRDHNHAEPVGYMLELGDDVNSATFQIASTEIARVKQEFDEHLRDGLSVGFTVHEYEIDDDWILHVLRADWYETSLCAIPAVQEAGVSSVAAALATARKEHHIMNRAQLAAALTAGTITQEQHDAALAALDATEALATPPADPVAPEVVDGPVLQVEQPAALQVNDRGLSMRQVISRLATAANTGVMGNLQLAIADVVPADDAAPAWLRSDWQGEAWRDNDETRPWIDAFGAVQPLENLTGKGWKWDDADENGDGGEPLVDEYSGNKTEVPSNEIGTAELTWTAFRIAGGWDVDRAFVDFANETFWASFFPAALRDYKRKSNAGIRTRVLAAASAPTGTVETGGVLAVLKQLYRDIRPYGRANRMFLGDDLFDEFADLKKDDLPIWLALASVGVDIAEGDADINTLHIFNDSTLTDTQAVAIDSRAAKVRERAPFRLEAQNIPHGGVDVGIFAYLRFDDEETRAIVKRTYPTESA